MIVLLGASGYVGQAFERALQERQQPFIALARHKLDYTRFEVLVEFLEQSHPTFLVNAAGYTGKPNVDACETARAETLEGNTLLPLTIAHACVAVGIPWGHVSSGCIYNGAKVVYNSRVETESDLTQPYARALCEQQPEAIHGFVETDLPNFSFRHPPCSFYSGTKALAEEAISGIGQTYIWRPRLPFDEFDNCRNYLSKVQRYPKVYDNVNSLSHRKDFAEACLDLWQRRAPFGIYNVTNPGFITTRRVVEMMQTILKPNKNFEFWASDDEFYRVAAKTLRSNCVLNVSKLLGTGVKMRPVEEALEEALKRWQKEL